MSLLPFTFAKSRVNFKMDSPNRTPAKSYASYKARARRKQIDFLISRDEFYELSQKPCNYCGEIRNGGNGLDRLNPDGPYSSYNVVSCCSECNYMKFVFTMPEFVSKVNKVYRHINGTKTKKPTSYYSFHIQSNSTIH
jgi:hypothetical protein